MLFVCLVENQSHGSVKGEDKTLPEYGNHISNEDKILPEDEYIKGNGEQRRQEPESTFASQRIEGLLILLLIIIMIFFLHNYIIIYIT